MYSYGLDILLVRIAVDTHVQVLMNEVRSTRLEASCGT